MFKITRIALERSAAKRAKFTYRIGMHYTTDQLVTVDESACNRRTSYRGYGWAIKGQRAVRKAFFVRGRRYVEYSFSFNFVIVELITSNL